MFLQVGLRRLRMRPLVHVAQRQFSSEKFRTDLQQRLAQLDRLFLTGVTRFHEITGYTEIERIKAELAEVETEVEKMRVKVRDARDLYNARVAQRSNSQREMNELLMRKTSWEARDLERFTELYKADHEIQVGVQDAKLDYDHVESELEEMQSHVGKLIGARYREEQMFSDRIRQASTWGTWVLMGINIVLFVVVQLILEPWKRRRLVRSFEAKVQQMMVQEREGQTALEKDIIEGVEKAGEEAGEKAGGEAIGKVDAQIDLALTWGNLWHRLQARELLVRPVELGALALACTLVPTVIALVK